MLSLTVNTPKPLFLSTPFLPNHRNLLPHPLTPQKPAKPLSVSALILPPSSSSYSTSSSSSQKQQQLYQPFRPPPSPLPPKFRNLDTNSRLQILSDRLGRWFEYAPLIPSLLQEGFISTTIEEITGIPSLEQNCLIVASQVRDSLLELADDDTVSFFDSPGSPQILYEIRILNNQQRVVAARFIIANGFDDKKLAEELARSMKDFPRRYGDKGWDSFDGNLPGDCLAFMHFRQAQEHKSASFPELSMAALERALQVVESERARLRVEADLENNEGEGKGEEDIEDDLVRVPVVRLAIGEVAESSVVVVLPVCRGEVVEEVVEAPWEVGMGGEFGVVEAEKGWRRWVVLPGWSPVAALRSGGGGGVAVAFPKARGVFPWRGKRRDADEEVLVVADRGRKEVEVDQGFYLVVGGGNGSGEEGLKVERGSRLKEIGVGVSLGTVVLVVRPPREELDDQLGDDDWE